MKIATPYEYQVKVRLMQIGQTQEWLADQIREKKGGYMDSTYMRKIIKGKVNSPNTISTINEILGINSRKSVHPRQTLSAGN